MRKHIWKLHSWIGLICALALVIIGLSGSMLVFHQEITDYFFPVTTLNEERAPETQRIPVSDLTAEVETTFPEFWIRGWLYNTQPHRRDKAYLNLKGTDDWYILHVDPYNGTIGKRPLKLSETFYGWFVQLHYTLFADHIGMALAGVFALGFLFLGISGIYLHKPFFKALFRLRWGKSARIFFSDFHKAIGVATIPMNLILGFTGAYWNLTHLVHEIVEHGLHEEDHPIDSRYSEYKTYIDDLPSIAETAISNYRLNYIYFPTEADPTYYLYGQHPEANNVLNSLYGSTVWVSAESGEVKFSQNLKDAGLWKKIADSFEPLHFGSFAGLTSQILWCIAGFSPAALSVTGILMYWKRKFRKPRSRARARLQTNTISRSKN